MENRDTEHYSFCLNEGKDVIAHSEVDTHQLVTVTNNSPNRKWWHNDKDVYQVNYQFLLLKLSVTLHTYMILSLSNSESLCPLGEKGNTISKVTDIKKAEEQGQFP